MLKQAAWRPLRSALVSTLFTVAVAYGVWAALGDQLRHAAWVLTRASSVPFVAAALTAYAFGMMCSLHAWRALLADLGRPVGPAIGGRIFFVGVLAKFIPGRLWTLATNIRMGRSAGIGAPLMAAVFVLSTAIGMVTGFAVGLLATPRVFGGHGWWFVVPAGLVLAGIVRPELVNSVAVVGARVLRRPAPDRAASRSGIRRALLAQLLCWLAGGVQLWALALALGAPVWRSLPVCVGAFALASVLGSLAVFTPDGLGVREITMTVPLAMILSWSQAGALVVSSRIVCTVAEVVLAVAVLAVTRTRRGRRQPAEVAGREPGRKP